jgi:hypothetical protein
MRGAVDGNSSAVVAAVEYEKQRNGSSDSESSDSESNGVTVRTVV